jgi:hypothetical protein
MLDAKTGLRQLHEDLPLTTACTGSSAPASSCTASPSGAVAIGLIVCTEGIVPHFRVGLGFDL